MSGPLNKDDNKSGSGSSTLNSTTDHTNTPPMTSNDSDTVANDQQDAPFEGVTDIDTANELTALLAEISSSTNVSHPSHSLIDTSTSLHPSTDSVNNYQASSEQAPETATSSSTSQISENSNDNNDDSNNNDLSMDIDVQQLLDSVNAVVEQMENGEDFAQSNITQEANSSNLNSDDKEDTSGNNESQVNKESNTDDYELGNLSSSLASMVYQLEQSQALADSNNSQQDSAQLELPKEHLSEDQEAKTTEHTPVTTLITTSELVQNILATSNEAASSNFSTTDLESFANDQNEQAENEPNETESSHLTSLILNALEMSLASEETSKESEVNESNEQISSNDTLMADLPPSTDAQQHTQQKEQDQVDSHQLDDDTNITQNLQLLEGILSGSDLGEIKESHDSTTDHSEKEIKNATEQSSQPTQTVPTTEEPQDSSLPQDDTVTDDQQTILAQLASLLQPENATADSNMEESSSSQPIEKDQAELNTTISSTTSTSESQTQASTTLEPLASQYQEEPEVSNEQLDLEKSIAEAISKSLVDQLLGSQPEEEQESNDTQPSQDDNVTGLEQFHTEEQEQNDDSIDYNALFNAVELALKEVSESEKTDETDNNTQNIDNNNGDENMAEQAVSEEVFSASDFEAALGPLLRANSLSEARRPQLSSIPESQSGSAVDEDDNLQTTANLVEALLSSGLLSMEQLNEFSRQADPSVPEKTQEPESKTSKAQRGTKLFRFAPTNSTSTISRARSSSQTSNFTSASKQSESSSSSNDNNASNSSKPSSGMSIAETLAFARSHMSFRPTENKIDPMVIRREMNLAMRSRTPSTSGDQSRPGIIGADPRVVGRVGNKLSYYQSLKSSLNQASESSSQNMPYHIYTPESSTGQGNTFKLSSTSSNMSGATSRLFNQISSSFSKNLASRTAQNRATGSKSTDNQSSLLSSSIRNRTNIGGPKTKFYYYTPPGASGQSSDKQSPSFSPKPMYTSSRNLTNAVNNAAIARNSANTLAAAVRAATSRRNSMNLGNNNNFNNPNNANDYSSTGDSDAKANMLTAFLLAKKVIEKSEQNKNKTTDSTSQASESAIQESSEQTPSEEADNFDLDFANDSDFDENGEVDESTMKAIEEALKALDQTLGEGALNDDDNTDPDTIKSTEGPDKNNTIDLTSSKDHESTASPQPPVLNQTGNLTSTSKKTTGRSTRKSKNDHLDELFPTPDYSGLSEKEKKKLENRLRKKKWRYNNIDRNRDNDLRTRVIKRANLLFGTEPSEARSKWIEKEFTSRKEKRLERTNGSSFMSGGVIPDLSSRHNTKTNNYRGERNDVGVFNLMTTASFSSNSNVDQSTVTSTTSPGYASAKRSIAAIINQSSKVANMNNTRSSPLSNVTSSSQVSKSQTPTVVDLTQDNTSLSKPSNSQTEIIDMTKSTSSLSINNQKTDNSINTDNLSPSSKRKRSMSTEIGVQKVAKSSTLDSHPTMNFSTDSVPSSNTISKPIDSSSSYTTSKPQDKHTVTVSSAQPRLKTPAPMVTPSTKPTFSYTTPPVSSPAVGPKRFNTYVHPTPLPTTKANYPPRRILTSSTPLTSLLKGQFNDAMIPRPLPFIPQPSPNGTKSPSPYIPQFPLFNSANASRYRTPFSNIATPRSADNTGRKDDQQNNGDKNMTSAAKSLSTSENINSGGHSSNVGKKSETATSKSPQISGIAHEMMKVVNSSTPKNTNNTSSPSPSSTSSNTLVSTSSNGNTASPAAPSTSSVAAAVAKAAQSTISSSTPSPFQSSQTSPGLNSPSPVPSSATPITGSTPVTTTTTTSG